MTDPTPPAILTAAQIDGMSAAYPDVVMPDTIALWRQWFIEQKNAPGIHTAQSHQKLYLACIELRRQVIDVMQERDKFRNERHDLEARLFGILFSAVPKDDATVVELADILAHRLTDTVTWLNKELPSCTCPECSEGAEQATVRVMDVLARLDPPQDH